MSHRYSVGAAAESVQLGRLNFESGVVLEKRAHVPTIVISRLFKGQRARHNPDKIHSYVYSAIGRLANESIELVRWQSTSRLSASARVNFGPDTPAVHHTQSEICATDTTP